MTTLIFHIITLNMYLKDFCRESLFEVYLKSTTNDFKYTWQNFLKMQKIGQIVLYLEILNFKYMKC